MTDTNSQEILQFLDKYFTSYENLDFDTCRALWDSNHPNLTWKPTETSYTMTTFSQISDYLEANRAIKLHTFRPSKIISIDFIRDDVVFAFAKMICRFDIPDTDDMRAVHMAGRLPFPPGEEVKWKGTASFIIHKAENEWKLIHYEDSTPWNLKNNAEDKDFE